MSNPLLQRVSYRQLVDLTAWLVTDQGLSRSIRCLPLTVYEASLVDGRTDRRLLIQYDPAGAPAHTVAHEVAHFLAPAGHGPEWVAEFVRMCSRMIDPTSPLPYLTGVWSPVCSGVTVADTKEIP